MAPEAADLAGTASASSIAPPTPPPADAVALPAPEQPSATQAAEPAPHHLPPTELRQRLDWAALGRAAMLLVVEGASFGLFVWTGLQPKLVPGYVGGNQLTPGQRTALLLTAATLGLLWTGAAAALYWLRGAGSTARLERVARRASPLIITGALPLLFNWGAWIGRDLTFLVLSVLVTFGFERALRASIDAGPCLLPAGAGERLAARWASLRQWLADRSNLPLLVVLAGALGYAAYFTVYTFQGHYRFDTYAFDLGIENNLVWNAVHWGPLFKTSPLGGPDATHIGFHQTYFAYVLGLPYRLWPDARMMLLMQAALIGAAAIPLYLWSKVRVGSWAAAIIALAYLWYPPLHGANLYDFHYQPLAPFFLWFTLYFFDRGQWGWTALFVLLSLSLREDISAMLVVFGLYLLVTNQRPKGALALIGVGTVFFVGLKLIIMPRFLGGVDAYIHQYQGLLPQGDHGFLGVLKTVFGNPAFTLGSVLERDKLVYSLQILAPLALLPLRRPIGLLLAVPGILFTLMATQYPPLVQTSFQYTTYWTLFLFPACAHILGTAELRRLRGPILAAFALAMAANTHQHGGILQHNTIRGGFGQYRWGLTEEDHRRHTDAYLVMQRLPRLAKVAASEALNPHVSSRPDAYPLRWTVYDAEYALFEIPRLRGDERGVVVQLLGGTEFGVVAERGGFVLLRRGEVTTRNAELLARLR